MKELVIDGSFESINLSIIDSKELVYDLHLYSINTHSKILTDIIDYALKSLSYNLNDIDNLYCCIGPGRYTSLRVTLATIKGMFFNKIESAYCFTSLDLMAATEDSDLPFRIVCDTSQTKTYFADYIKRGEFIERIDDIHSSTKKEAMKTSNKIVIKNSVDSTKDIFKIDSKHIKRIDLHALTPIY